MAASREAARRLQKLARTEGPAVVDALDRAPCGVPGSLKHRKFADMGYLPDGLKRFPLDSRAEAATAWRHVSQPANAILYTPQQLKRIYGRIAGAFRALGVPAELANRKTMAELEASIEGRRVEIEGYRRLAAPAHQPTDKQIRQRTGLDDHLELGEHKPPKLRKMPPGPVVRRILPPTG